MKDIDDEAFCVDFVVSHKTIPNCSVTVMAFADVLDSSKTFRQNMSYIYFERSGVMLMAKRMSMVMAFGSRADLFDLVGEESEQGDKHKNDDQRPTPTTSGRKNEQTEHVTRSKLLRATHLAN